MIDRPFLFPVDGSHTAGNKRALTVRDVVSLATAWSMECSGCCVICPLTPNAKAYDCLGYFNPLRPGWKAARSRHFGGVNVLFCDGHVQFIKDSVNQVVWR